MDWWRSLSPAIRFRLSLATIIVLFTVLLGCILSYSLSRHVVEQTKTATTIAVQQHIEYLFTNLFTTKQNFSSEQIKSIVRMHFDLYHIVDTDFYRTDQTIIFSYENNRVGTKAAAAELGLLTTVLQERQVIPQVRDNTLTLWLPIIDENSHDVLGAVRVERDMTPEMEAYGQTFLLCLAVILAGGLLLFLLLRRIYDHSTEQIEEQAEKVRMMLREVNTTYNASLQVLSSALDSRDNETNGHAYRVTAYTLRLAREMGIRHEQLADIMRGALLHDVGKIGVPDAILLKPGPLTPEEWEIMRSHVEIGYQMLRHIPFLEPALDIVRYHHERWDGKGYPCGLKAAEIPLAARIFAVCDTFDAMLSDRPYRKGRSYEEVREEIRQKAGSQFDPAVVEAFLRIPAEEWRQIAYRAKDAHQDRQQWDRLADILPDQAEIAG